MKRFLVCLTIGLFVFTGIPVQAEIKGKPVEGEVYEEVRVKEMMPYNNKRSINISEEKLEIKEKMAEMSNYKMLQPKTESNYEIALAYSDGSYKYMKDTNDFENALVEVNELEKAYNDNTVIPAIINNDGQVIYSTNSMGRIWNHRNGEALQGDTVVTNIFLDSSLTNAYTYINQVSIDDVPIIEDAGKSAKIQVSGYKGWINKDSASGNYDLVVVPINQVTNPSCYYVSNGFLYHYISYNMTDLNDTNGHQIIIGKAPDFLVPGVEYYSYDGIYFYSGNSRVDGLNKLVTDLKNSTNSNAVNYDKPHYNYYGYLPFRTKSNYTAEELNSFINSNTVDYSKLRGIGQALIDGQDKYGVNPVLALGVAINESKWGESPIAQEKNNLFGIKAVDSNPGESASAFATPGDSVLEFCKNYISSGYADPNDWRYYGGYLGNKALGANVKYASDPYWGEKAAQHVFTVDYELSGKNLNNLRDYDGYQIGLLTGGNDVLNSKGELLYNINPTVSGYGGYAGNLVALKFNYKNNLGRYQIFADRTTNINEGTYGGNYDWNENGFINSNNVKLVNNPKNSFISGYSKEDVNKDGEIDIEDISVAALNYNKTTDFYPQIDINEDGIIDLFDIVYISKSIKS
ncbi:glucosaminidase domain-containing protein [Clostridium sp. MB05]|uniref:glucosaminidase domain-containing protein n=1 Tax=Clostridium sp. MB05 TaxID=3376682 RepID=UPI0039822F3C